MAPAVRLQWALVRGVVQASAQVAVLTKEVEPGLTVLHAKGLVVPNQGEARMAPSQTAVDRTAHRWGVPRPRAGDFMAVVRSSLNRRSEHQRQAKTPTPEQLRVLESGEASFGDRSATRNLHFLRFASVRKPYRLEAMGRSLARTVA